MINVLRTVISQYGNSPTLLQLLNNMDAYIDPRTNFADFFNFVWNVDTAQGFGLDIWGRIVVVSRYLEIDEPVEFFGFNEAGDACPFDDAPFFSGELVSSNTYRLSDDAYRKLILVKALANITSCTAPGLNQLIRNLFAEQGACYVNDLGGMAMRYTFEFELSAYDRAILLKSGIFPHPAGVATSVLETPDVWGFYEAGDATPFDDQPFISEAAAYAIS